MKVTLALFASLAVVFALPAPPTGASTSGSCTFSANEKSNLGHNHDVNTGQLLVGGKVVKGAPKIGGSGCSPAWAVGGDPSDKTPTKTTAGAAKGAEGAAAAPAAAPAAGGHQHGY